MNLENIANEIDKKVIGESRTEIEFSVFIDEIESMIIKDRFENDTNASSVNLSVELEEKNGRKDFRISITEESTYSWEKSKKKELIAIFINEKDGMVWHSRHSVYSDFENITDWARSLRFKKTKILNIEEYERDIDSSDIDY